MYHIIRLDLRKLSGQALRIRTYVAVNFLTQLMVMLLMYALLNTQKQ